MTNKEIWETAFLQSSYDCNCAPEDFLGKHNIITISQKHPKARRYLSLPFACDLVSYGNNIVAQCDKKLVSSVEKYISSYPVEHCFETPHLHVLDALLQPHGLKVCFMAEYFLPDLSQVRRLPCSYPLRLLYPEDFTNLYLPEWSNALCEKRKELDILGCKRQEKSRPVLEKNQTTCA